MRREARAAVFCKPEDSVLSSEAGLFEAAPYHCPRGALQTHSPGRLALWVGHGRLQGQGGQELASQHRAVAMEKPLSLEPCVPALPAPPWAAASQREGWGLRSQATAQWTLGGTLASEAVGTGGTLAPEDRESNQAGIPDTGQSDAHARHRPGWEHCP